MAFTPTAWTAPLCCLRRCTSAFSEAGSPASAASQASTRFHTRTSAETPWNDVCPDASVRPSFETHRHETSFEWPSRNASTARADDAPDCRTTIWDPSG